MSNQTNTVVQIKPTFEDYYVLRDELLRQARATFRYRMLTWLLFAIYGIVVAAAVEYFVAVQHVPAWLAVVGCIYPAALVQSAISSASEPLFYPAYLDTRGKFLSGFQLCAEDDGLNLQGDWGQTRYFWSAVLRVKETATHIFVFVDRTSALLIPKKAFASPEDAVRFAALARTRGAPSARVPS